jgi:prepilin-type processing-associated H-X9-DG protein
VEQGLLYNQINFSQGVASGGNAQAARQSLAIYQCPSDPGQQNVPIYDSNFSTPIATVAHANYFGCNGWVECFGGAGGNYQPGNDGGAAEDGDVGAIGPAGRGAFYRNSHFRMVDVKDGLSSTIIVGERCAAHSPGTWTAAVPGGRCPSWMATQPWTNPYTSPSSAPDTGNGTAYDNADYGEALVLSHGNATHLPSVDNPVFDPDVFWSLHTPKGANFLFGDGSVHYLTSSIDPYTYQYLCTIAGGETLKNW